MNSTPFSSSHAIAPGASDVSTRTSARFAVSCELRQTSSAWSSGESSSPTAAWIPPCALAELQDWSEPFAASTTRAPARSAERAAASPDAPLPITSTSKACVRTVGLYHDAANAMDQLHLCACLGPAIRDHAGVADPDPRVRWPNLFVVGGGRCGTTSLWWYLSQHPDVFMCDPKEPHYFSGARPSFIPYVKTEEEYLALFAGRNEPVLGEASPTYLANPDSAQRIDAVSPDARFVAVIRHPIERAHSAYWHRIRYGLETRSFLEAVREELTTKSHRYGYVGAGRYSPGVRRYLELAPDRTLVFVFEELFADPRAGMREIFEFLAVDPTVADRLSLDRLNAFSVPRGAAAGRLYRSRRVRSLARRFVPRRHHARAERLALGRAEPPAIDREAWELVADAVAADVPKLAELLGRELPWDLRAPTQPSQERAPGGR